MENGWVELACAGLSADDIKRKLEQLRTTPQTNPHSKQLLDAEAAVSSKAADIEKVEQELESIRQERAKLDVLVQADISEKTLHDEQVHGAHTQAYAHAHTSMQSISLAHAKNANPIVRLLRASTTD